MAEKKMQKTHVAKAATGTNAAWLHLHVAHRIEALLRTMRSIERHEEQLCVVMTEIRAEGTVSEEASRELHELLGELPAEAYQTDLDAVSQALAAARPEGQSGSGVRPKGRHGGSGAPAKGRPVKSAARAR